MKHDINGFIPSPLSAHVPCPHRGGDRGGGDRGGGGEGRGRGGGLGSENAETSGGKPWL